MVLERRCLPMFAAIVLALFPLRDERRFSLGELLGRAELVVGGVVQTRDSGQLSFEIRDVVVGKSERKSLPVKNRISAKPVEPPRYLVGQRSVLFLVRGSVPSAQWKVDFAQAADYQAFLQRLRAYRDGSILPKLSSEFAAGGGAGPFAEADRLATDIVALLTHKKDAAGLLAFADKYRARYADRRALPELRKVLEDAATGQASKSRIRQAIQLLSTKRTGSRSWRPTKEHRVERIEGFEIRVDPRLDSRVVLRKATLAELGHQLYAIRRKVPAAALARLRKVTIWVSWASKTRCAAYHPSRVWLTRNQRNPDFAHGVEIGNPATFLAWTKQQPWMVLHELAHAYHDQVLDGGYQNPLLRAALERCKKAKLYDHVRHVNGQLVRHYALTNPMEFFAEASEAYFGTNDMFPFVRGELAAHDPKTFALLAKLWGAP